MDVSSRYSRHSLTFRQAIRVLVAAIIVGLMIFTIELYQTYKGSIEDNLKFQKQVIDLAYSPSSSAVWSLDEQLAKETIRGLLAIHLVSSGKIISDDGEVLTEQAKPPTESESWLLKILNPMFDQLHQVKYPIYAPDDAFSTFKERPLGELTLTFDTKIMTQAFIHRINRLFWNILLASLSLAIVLGYMFQRFLTRPILALSNTIQQIKTDVPRNFAIDFPKGHKKGELSLLVTRFNQLMSRLNNSQRNLQYLATRDPLTGLPNRALIYEELGANIRRAKSQQYSFAVFFLDLNRFKHINDTLGHSFGDQLLCHIAESLQKNIPSNARIGRLGGDEFFIICESYQSKESTAEIAEGIIDTVKQPVCLNHVTIEPSCSIGIAVFPEDGHDMETLVRHADLAMYQAKKRNTPSYVFFHASIEALSEERFNIELKLKPAIENEEFKLFFQPKIDLKTLNLAGCEGLIRWYKDDLIIGPNKFIPIAEDTHHIIQIGRIVIELACQTISKWQDMGTPIPISINVSPIQLQAPDFIKQLEWVLNKYPDAARWLELEITESSLMTNFDHTLSLFSEIKSHGIGISIDDFGTGYSCLSYLHRLQIDSIKIDQSFVSGLPKETRIPSTILSLAEKMQLKTVAEGVENRSQLAWLASHGCDFIQGYYFSEPLKEHDFTERYVLNKSINSRVTTL